MKRRLSLLAFTVLLIETISLSSYGQRLVTGKLVDKETGKPIKEATIKLLGTNIETKVNALGFFQLQIDSIEQISINSPGYDFAEMVVPMANSFKIEITKAAVPPEEKRKYLDRFDFPCDKSNAVSYQVINQHPNEANKFLVEAYDLNDKIKQIATCSDMNIYSKDGYFTSFFDNRQRSEEGFYNANLKVGQWKKWYENGKLMEESFHYKSNDNIPGDRIDNFYDSLGNKLVINGNGEYIIYEKDLHSYAKGSIKNGLKTGKWIGYFKNGKVAYEEEYDESKLVSGVSYDSLGKEYKYSEIIDYSDLLKFLGSNVKYPQEERRIGIQGTVVIHFVLDHDGQILKSRIAKGIGSACDKEALRVVIKYGSNWKNRKIRGQPLKLTTAQSLYCPIKFKIAE